MLLMLRHPPALRFVWCRSTSAAALPSTPIPAGAILLMSATAIVLHSTWLSLMLLLRRLQLWWLMLRLCMLLLSMLKMRLARQIARGHPLHDRWN